LVKALVEDPSSNKNNKDTIDVLIKTMETIGKEKQRVLDLLEGKRLIDSGDMSKAKNAFKTLASKLSSDDETLHDSARVKVRELLKESLKEVTILGLTVEKTPASTSRAGEEKGAAYNEFTAAGDDDVATKGITHTQEEAAKSLDVITSLMKKIGEDLESKAGDEDKAFTGAEVGEVNTIVVQAKKIEAEVKAYKAGDYKGILTKTNGISESVGAATVDLSVTTDKSNLSGDASTAEGDLTTIAGAEDAEQNAKIELINALGEQEFSANDASAAAGEIFSDLDLFTIKLSENPEAVEKVTVETLNQLKDLVKGYKKGITKKEQEEFDKRLVRSLNLLPLRLVLIQSLVKILETKQIMLILKVLVIQM
jgi:hypothetical protein